jgi:hypothetical protein
MAPGRPDARADAHAEAEARIAARYRAITTGRSDSTFARTVTFNRLEAVSCFHSCIYLGLLLCAFVFGNPEPLTFILGLSHGLLWIAMSLLCIASTRWRVIPFWLAVLVAVLGGLGPFMGSLGFVIEARRRHAAPRAEPASR